MSTHSEPDGIVTSVKGEAGHKYVITILDNELWIEDYDELGVECGKIAFLISEFFAVVKNAFSLLHNHHQSRTGGDRKE